MPHKSRCPVVQPSAPGLTAVLAFGLALPKLVQERLGGRQWLSLRDALLSFPGGKRTVETQWRRQPKANNKQCLKETCLGILQVCLDVCLPARKRESMAAKMDETLKQWKMTETKSLETANILHWSCHAVLACTAPIQSPNLR